MNDTIDRSVAVHRALVQRVAPLLALDDGFPVSGDALRRASRDPHPTQPHRFPDLLWPAVTR